ncbi:hypothetical protein HYW74_05125 [Candidatus Pacearchaeota archaeon]|nr:hypothetical protein [Candidatus Pacearchaeota archaeon]
MNLKRSGNLDTSKLVSGYDMDEKYRPIIEQYVTDVYDLFSGSINKVNKNVEKIAESLGCLGMVVSPVVGAGVGAMIGYLVDGSNGARKFAEGGAITGFIAELFIRPSAIFLAYKYVDSQFQSCEEPRAIYRNQTLSKLENL